MKPAAIALLIATLLGILAYFRWAGLKGVLSFFLGGLIFTTATLFITYKKSHAVKYLVDKMEEIIK